MDELIIAKLNKKYFYSDIDTDHEIKAMTPYIKPECTGFLHSDDDSCNSYEETFENVCLKILKCL